MRNTVLELVALCSTRYGDDSLTRVFKLLSCGRLVADTALPSDPTPIQKPRNQVSLKISFVLAGAPESFVVIGTETPWTSQDLIVHGVL